MFTIQRSRLLFLIFIFFILSIFTPILVRADVYTGTINVNSADGGDCNLIGAWDSDSKTCTLDKDLLGPLNINSNGITLDGAEHTISRNTQDPFFQRFGITINGSNVFIKNVSVKGFSSCLIFGGGSVNGYVQDSEISRCGSHGIYLFSSSSSNTFLNNNFSQNFIGIFVNSSNNIIKDNIFNLNSPYGIRTYFSSNNVIENNTISGGSMGLYTEYGAGNRIIKNTIENTRSHGIYGVSLEVNRNYIVNNNLINNGDGQVSVHDKNQYYNELPIGGNYWSNYDEPSEGCNDLNIDNICDQPKYFNPYNPTYGDFYPWVKRDGWKGEKESKKIISSFSLNGLTPSVEGVIDEINHKIELNIPFGVDISALVPTISISSRASIVPESGLAQDFRNPVVYTVTAEDGSTQEYVVTVTASCISDCFSSVLFLPGLESSRLYKTRAGGSEDQLWEPNANSDVEDLYLNTDGMSKDPNIYTRDIIKETNSPVPSGSLGQNIYKSFSEMMDVLFDEHKIAEWKEFAYDWRQSVDDIVNNGTKYQGKTVSLIETLQSLVETSKNGKVTIVAHSNGGLLAKALLKKLQDDKNAGKNNLIDKIDVLILVGVPQIGTAKAVPAIMHGYDQRIGLGLLMDETRARGLGRNMLGAFGLLPSKEYINHVSASPATFVDTAIPSNVTTKMVQTFGSAISSYDEYKSFLMGGEGRTDPPIDRTHLPIILSQSLFSQAESLHDSIDAFTPPESLRVIEVAGWGLDTVASMEYYPQLNACGGQGPTACPVGYFLDQKPRFTSDGDGTVVVPSAHYMSFLGDAEKYWVNLPFYNDGFTKNREHADILEVDPVLNFISSTIQKLTPDNPPYLSTTVPVDTKNRFRISIHSPVTIDAYDQEGNHTGKICPPNSDFCYAEENIANSSYLEFGEGKYINLSEDQMFKIKLQGTDVGTFTYDSEKVSPDGTSAVSFFIDIPVTTQTEAEITLNSSTGAPQMALDVTGDGVTDFTITPNANFDPILYLQIMKATIDSLDLPVSKIQIFDKRIDAVIKSIQEGKIDKAKLKAGKFKSALEKTLSKADSKNPKPKKLSKTDAQLLLDMINKLLDNIS